MTASARPRPTYAPACAPGTGPAARPLVVSGCGVVSAAGRGLAALAALAERAGAGAPAPGADPGPLGDDGPPVGVRGVPRLEAEQLLGRKGLGSLDRTTKLALVACHDVLEGLGAPLDAGDRERTGVVLGTSTGSIRSSSEFSYDTLKQDKPYLVRASLFPNSVMNCCASQLALRNGMRGVNATLAAGRLSSHAAFRYARNAIVRGHVERTVVGGVEELCPQSAWAWHLSGALLPGVAVGEGAAVFVVQHRETAAASGHPALAEILACELVSSEGPGRRAAARSMARAVRGALRRSAVDPGEVTTVVPGAGPQAVLAEVEEQGVAEGLGRPVPQRLDLTAAMGETFSASGALQLAALLAMRPGGDGGPALVTGVDHDGAAGCLVVRPLP